MCQKKVKFVKVFFLSFKALKCPVHKCHSHLFIVRVLCIAFYLRQSRKVNVFVILRQTTFTCVKGAQKQKKVRLGQNVKMSNCVKMSVSKNVQS